MSASITVLYPPPTDFEKFAVDYKEHLSVFAEHLPDVAAPQVTLVKSHPKNPAPYHMIVTISFDSMEDLGATLKSEGMATVGGHANEISTGGPPVILVGASA